MSKRKRWVLIALTWAAAAVLCALPSLWPAYGHVIGTRIFRDYELEAYGILTGWLTCSILGRRHRK